MGSGKAIARTARACALLVGCALAPSASALYVGMYAIGDFTATCGGNDIPAWPGMAQAWWDEMRARGHYGGPSGNLYKYVDGNMTIRRFCDPDTYHVDCRDYQSAYPSGVDWMDAAIVAAHGWDDGDHWGALMRWPFNGDCGLRMGGSSNQVRLGDSWIVFFHASSCQSADADNLDGIRFAMQDTSTSGTRRAHQFDGFHGIMWISSSFNGDYRDTAADGHSVSVGWSWTTNHYKNNSVGCEWYDPFNWFGTCDDQCPVAYSIGSTGSDSLTRLVNERYNFVYGDPTGISSYHFYYYPGCDPVGEGPM